MYKRQTSHCVVIPSYSEGFCFAAAETIALGTPVISSGKGALKEVVSGKFIEMESFDKQDLFSALEKAYHGAWTSKPIKHFELKTTVKNYLALYE